MSSWNLKFLLQNLPNERKLNFDSCIISEVQQPRVIFDLWSDSIEWREARDGRGGGVLLRGDRGVGWEGVGVASQINPPSNFSHFPSRPLSDHPITSTDGSLDHPLEYVHISTQMENYFLFCQKLSNIKYSFWSASCPVCWMKAEVQSQGTVGHEV